MSLSIIVAISENNCIGKTNELLWKIPADMKHFKETTTGHPIIMGKKTYLSIGRALPNRRNIVLTRDSEFEAEGVEVLHSVDEAISLFEESLEEAFVIGGGEIYAQFLPHVSKMYVTHVHAEFGGDTFFPHIDTNTWKETSNVEMEVSESTAYLLTFSIYERT